MKLFLRPILYYSPPHAFYPERQKDKVESKLRRRRRKKRRRRRRKEGR
jgi:hypothetical protein